MGGCESKTAEELVDVEDDIYYRTHFQGIKDPEKKASVMQSPLPPLSTWNVDSEKSKGPDTSDRVAEGPSGPSVGGDATVCRYGDNSREITEVRMISREARAAAFGQKTLDLATHSGTSGHERKASEELCSRPLQNTEATAAMLEEQHADSTRQQGHAGGQQARDDKETLAKPRGDDQSGEARSGYLRASQDEIDRIEARVHEFNRVNVPGYISPERPSQSTGPMAKPFNMPPAFPILHDDLAPPVSAQRNIPPLPPFPPSPPSTTPPPRRLGRTPQMTLIRKDGQTLDQWPSNLL